jgi:hypothetical protein
LVPFVGLSIGAAVDGIPCTTAQMSDADHTILELTCSLPPGNASKPKPKLVITSRQYTASLKEYYVAIPGGALEVPVKECPAAPAPVAGVSIPQLCRVAAGSTADVGKGYEGIFSSRNPMDQRYGDSGLMIASDGTYVSAGGYGDCEGGQLVPTEEWTQENGYVCDTVNDIQAQSNVFRAAGSSTQKSYVPYKGKDRINDSYSVANALAVSMTSVAGTWKSYDEYTTISIVVSGDSGTITGTITGTYPCVISGTIRLHEPATAKNLYDISLTATSLGDAASYAQCYIPADATLKGFAAISFVNTGTQLNPIYAYAFDYAAYQVDKGALGARLIKQ